MMSVAPASPAVRVRSFPLAVVAIVVIGFVGVLLSSVTSMALTPLADVFDTSMGTIVWVTTVFLLAAGLTMPIAGWAVDRFGGRAVLLVGLILFVAGSLGSGLSESVGQLLASRAIQGLGGGLLEPASLALLSQITPRARIGAVMGLMGAVINVAPAIGPLVGGVLLSSGGWRSIFFFAVPPVLLALVLLVLSVSGGGGERAAESRAGVRLDLRGVILLCAGFAAALFAVARIGGAGMPTTIIVGVLGLGLLCGYVVHARKAAEPVVDPALFGDRRFSGAVAIMGTGGILTFSILTMAPILAERVWNLDGITRGLPLGAFGLGVLVSMSLSGWLSDRLGSRRIVTVGAGTCAVALAATALLSDGLAVPHVSGPLLLGVAGLAFGMVLAPTFAVIYRVLPDSVVGRGTTAALIASQLGSALGATVIGVVLDALQDSAFTAALVVLSTAMLCAALVAHRTLDGRGDESEEVSIAVAHGTES